MRASRTLTLLAVLAVSMGVVSVAVAAPPAEGPAGAFAYWTPERIASAAPRDLMLDDRGLAYLRAADGALVPYGHEVAARARPLTVVPSQREVPVPTAKPGSGSDTAPTIGAMDPSSGATIGASHTFSAVITDDGTVKKVTMYVRSSGAPTFQAFSMSYAGNDVWTTSLQGFSDGSWEWYVVAKDNGPQGGHTTTSATVGFTVATSGGGGGGETVTNAHWTDGGDVQAAAGRILFTMPGGDYVCSGTAIVDGITGRSIVLTAAHCVYDDVNKVFASNAIFIPDQDGTTGSGTDWDCSNDPIGCWAVDHGVVDVNWTTRTFPDNIPWDYGFYVISDSGAHSGPGDPEVLDAAVPPLTAQFTAPAVGDPTHALGYSYSNDPLFMYCAEAMGTNGSANYWLGSCDLSGGSSGGPWLQPVDGGNGPVISVNSWGYTTQPGMAGPRLHDNSAAAVFAFATTTDLASGDRGFPYDPTGGTATLSGSSTSQGGTWTATVVSSAVESLGGSWDYPATSTCDGNSCDLSGIPKRQASVTFVATSGEVLEVFKP